MDGVAGPDQLGEEPAKVGHNDVDEAGEEPLLGTKRLAAVPDGAAEHTAKDKVAALIARPRAIGNREGQGPDVVRDDTVRHVNAIGIILANLGIRKGGST